MKSKEGQNYEALWTDHKNKAKSRALGYTHHPLCESHFKMYLRIENKRLAQASYSHSPFHFP